ncbi:GTPase IMAP family member 2-like [Notothenia coriiceps]|uniref:GTPase IMAP family member 2-like n=1 Tax=Notothenia coriiceps TaxID=8208 RepID=A0A6I9MPL7_9TELE|nr:PREDICTED: GTPase IMAP family member 2-like [Notothenia coriiceps]
MLGLPGADFDSVSTETTSASATVEDCEVTVIDTPGFTDKHLTPEQLYLQIMRSTLEGSPGVHAFVIVVRVDRITEADIKLFELLPKLFEGDALKYSMVLFTHGDNLKGQSIEGLMKKNDHVSELVSMCGGRYCVFDNNTKSSKEQVRTFLDKVNEMVSANGGQYYTDQMFRMSETFFREERIQFKKGASGGGEEKKESLLKEIEPYVSFGAVGGAALALLAALAALAAAAPATLTTLAGAE